MILVEFVCYVMGHGSQNIDGDLTHCGLTHCGLTHCGLSNSMVTPISSQVHGALSSMFDEQKSEFVEFKSKSPKIGESANLNDTNQVLHNEKNIVSLSLSLSF